MTELINNSLRDSRSLQRPNQAYLYSCTLYILKIFQWKFFEIDPLKIFLFLIWCFAQIGEDVGRQVPMQRWALVTRCCPTTTMKCLPGGGTCSRCLSVRPACSSVRLFVPRASAGPPAELAGFYLAYYKDYFWESPSRHHPLYRYAILRGVDAATHT